MTSKSFQHQGFTEKMGTVHPFLVGVSELQLKMAIMSDLRKEKKMDALLRKTIDRQPIYEDDLADALLEICKREHSSCNSECPVFDKNNGPLHPERPLKENRGCDCFKNGYKMLDFLRS